MKGLQASQEIRNVKGLHAAKEWHVKEASLGNPYTSFWDDPRKASKETVDAFKNVGQKGADFTAGAANMATAPFRGIASFGKNLFGGGGSSSGGSSGGGTSYQGGRGPSKDQLFNQIDSAENLASGALGGLAGGALGRHVGGMFDRTADKYFGGRGKPDGRPKPSIGKTVGSLAGTGLGALAGSRLSDTIMHRGEVNSLSDMFRHGDFFNP